MTEIPKHERGPSIRQKRFNYTFRGVTAPLTPLQVTALETLVEMKLIAKDEFIPRMVRPDIANDNPTNSLLGARLEGSLKDLQRIFGPDIFSYAVLKTKDRKKRPTIYYQLLEKPTEEGEECNVPFRGNRQKKDTHIPLVRGAADEKLKKHILEQDLPPTEQRIIMRMLENDGINPSPIAELNREGNTSGRKSEHITLEQILNIAASSGLKIKLNPKEGTYTLVRIYT